MKKINRFYLIIFVTAIISLICLINLNSYLFAIVFGMVVIAYILTMGYMLELKDDQLNESELNFINNMD